MHSPTTLLLLSTILFVGASAAQASTRPEDSDPVARRPSEPHASPAAAATAAPPSHSPPGPKNESGRKDGAPLVAAGRPPEGREAPASAGRRSDGAAHAAHLLSEFTVTARRRSEAAQDVPIPISVIGGSEVDATQSFNVNRLKELIPSVQFYSSNPRNTAVNIRGQGTTFGLTNDGIDTSVGFYVDGVFLARPAATTLDFLDVERIEVLRGPQGTLFGKNTTAGAFNITSRKPSFTPQGRLETSYGNFGFIQTKASLTGPLGEHLAGRLSVSGTRRDGLLLNTLTRQKVNELDNLGVRGQLLYSVDGRVDILLSADLSRQHPVGYAQILAGVVPTRRAAYRQFNAIIADLGYAVPETNPFARRIDHDSEWRSGNDYGGLSLNVDVELPAGTLTSTTAWRFWDWDPSNDRDFTALPALALSQATSTHQQASQEIRWAGRLSSRLTGVIGLYALTQKLRPDPVQIEEAGRAQWRFAQSSTSSLWKTPGLLDGYGIKSYPTLDSLSGATFGQVEWSLSRRLDLLVGLRVNYDDKKVDFRRETYGGLQTSDPALLALKRAVYSDQAFQAQVDDTVVSGQFTANFAAAERWRIFATYATGHKPVGLNLGGLPTEGSRVMTELAVVKPESVGHLEVGVKANPTASSTVNLSVFNTDIDDYQTLVQAPDLALNRGYLANAEKVRVRGAELDATLRGRGVSLRASLAYSDGKYVRFTNAPPPLEETGGPTFKDISGGRLPGLSRWAASAGAEFTRPSRVPGVVGEWVLGVDASYRSSFSSSPTPSRYLNIAGYTVANARIGIRTSRRLELYLWARNVLDRDYFEQLLPAGGNAGQYAAVLGDPRTVGVTLRFEY